MLHPRVVAIKCQTGISVAPSKGPPHEISPSHSKSQRNAAKSISFGTVEGAIRIKTANRSNPARVKLDYVGNGTSPDDERNCWISSEHSGVDSSRSGPNWLWWIHRLHHRANWPQLRQFNGLRPRYAADGAVRKFWRNVDLERHRMDPGRWSRHPRLHHNVHQHCGFQKYFRVGV